VSYVAVGRGLGGDDCPSGMVDDGEDGCTAAVPPTGGLEPYASPNYVPPTGGLYSYGTPAPEEPSSSGITFMTAIAVASLFLL
jgi:hypothetical protein